VLGKQSKKKNKKMPQLDKLTWFSQIFWVFALFLTFYILIVKNMLPQIGSMLKIRRKRIQAEAMAADNAMVELESIQQSLDGLLANSLAMSRDLVNDTNASLNSQSHLALLSMNKSADGFNASNKQWVNSLENIVAAKNVLQK
jgi:F0F1-type ATP synthase membrane subunit b/b'